jgi:DNA-binding NtrC family response regulator
LGRKVKILLVDDEELICWSLKQSFEKAGDYSVNCAYTGNDALHKLNENHYDIVITDLNLPDIEDFEIVKKIRDLTSDTPLIVISAYLSDPVLNDVLKHGVFRCISKPFEIQDVLGEVREAVKFTIQGNS